MELNRQAFNIDFSLSLRIRLRKTDAGGRPGIYPRYYVNRNNWALAPEECTSHLDVVKELAPAQSDLDQSTRENPTPYLMRQSAKSLAMSGLATVQSRPGDLGCSGTCGLDYFLKTLFSGNPFAKYLMVEHWRCPLLEICDSALGHTCTTCRCTRLANTTLSRRLCTRYALYPEDRRNLQGRVLSPSATV